MTSHTDTAFESYEEALVRVCYDVLLGRPIEPSASVSLTAPRIEPEQEDRLRDVLRRFLDSEEFKGRDAHVVGTPLLPVHQLVHGMRQEVEDKIRALCQTTYLGQETALCRILGSFHMFVHTSDVGFATHILHRGVWEMWLTEFMVRTIRPGMRVLDVGGNFGYYSVLMSALVEASGHCHIFEPNQTIARLLRRTQNVNGFDDRSKVWELALSNREDDAVHFFIPHAEPKNAQLVAGVAEGLDHIGAFTQVPVRSMDSMAEELGVIDFIKIDTEGAEFDILVGMRGIAKSQRPTIVVEVNCGRGYDAAMILEEYRDIYGAIRVIGGDGLSHPISIEEILTTKIGSDWLVHFARPDNTQ